MNHRSLFTLFLLTLCAGSGFSQSTGKVPLEGSEYFRFGLHLKDIKPHSEAKQALDNPQTSMIIVLGDTSQLQNLIASERLRTFLRNGGALLIATDDSHVNGAIAMDAGWASTFGVTITGNKLTAPPAKCFDQVDGRIFVRPLPGNGEASSPFQIFEGVEEFGPAGVVTDHPSELVFAPNRIDRIGYIRDSLAAYADGTFRQRDRRQIPNGVLFAASIRPNQGPGRMVVMADHYVFANEMMTIVEDPTLTKPFLTRNGNWAFTNRTIDWLQGGLNKPRTHCLFIEDGQIIEKFAIEVPRPPTPPIPDLPPEVIANIVLNSMNGIIDNAQEKNLFNRMLEGWLGFPQLLRLFLMLVTLPFVYSCLRLLIRVHRKAHASAHISPREQAALQPRGGVLRQRTASQIEVGNLFEAASRRVRDRFNVLGGQSGSAGAMAPILVAADVRDGPILLRTVEWLWQIGYGDAPVNVPPAEWDRLNELLERVMSRAARGDWSFGQDV